jgi:hypothetical protein
MTRTIFVAVALALAVTLPAVPAHAQSIRTFVSTTGSDSNPCSLIAPCRHFSAAVTATAAGGEVDALEPGAYGSFTISQAITIEGQGWSYVAPPVNGAAITVSAGSGNVILRGVLLNGAAVANSVGILVSAVGSLSVRDSAMQFFSEAGIAINASSQVSVSNSVISDNGEEGIVLEGFSGTVNCVLDHVLIENNAYYGLEVTSYFSAAANVTVSDSVISNNAQGKGIYATGTTQPVYVAVRRSNISNNSTGVQADSNAVVRLSQSVITGNATGWTITNGGSVASTSDNLIDDNPAGNGNPPAFGYK